MGSQRAETKVVSPYLPEAMPLIQETVSRTKSELQNPMWDILRRQALAGIQGGGNQGLYNTGVTQLRNTLSGTYLDPSSNPWLEGAVQAVARPIQQMAEDQSKRLGAQYNAGGMFYSGPAIEQQRRLMENTQQQIGDLAARMYANAYAQERANQMGALGQALGYSQLPLQNAYAMFNLAQLPYNQATSLLGALQGRLTQDTYYPSAAQQILTSAIQAAPFFFMG